MQSHHSHRNHLRRRIKQRHELFREEPENDSSYRHQSDAVSGTDTHRLLESVPSVRAVVVRDDRHRRVVHAEERHEYEALQFEIYCESCNRERREH